MNKYLIKIAASKERPHHLDALKQLDRENGILVDHSTGSGKTRLFLTAVANAQKKHPDEDALIIAPASLITNIDKEIKKHGIKINREKLVAMSYEMAANRADDLKKRKFSITVADEGHKLRNKDTKRSRELTDIIMGSRKRVIATATPSYNHISDIAPLVNLAAGKDVLPTGKADFEKRYVNTKIEKDHFIKRVLGINKDDKEVKSLNNTKELGKVLNKYVHHYNLKEDPEAKGEFPTSSDETFEVPMSKTQETMYKFMENKIPFYTRMKIRMNLPLDKKESANLNSFSTGMRQVSNSTRPYLPGHDELSPKIQQAVDNLTKAHGSDKRFKGLVYSNYLKAGLDEYSEALKKKGIKHAVYHGGLSAKEKDQIVKDYNEGDLKAILASSSGAEGLDLKGTKLTQILEPHFNKSKIDQVRGRGVRYKSHSHLPKEERHVKIEHYHSVFPKGGFFSKAKGTSIDSYLHNNSQDKNDLSDQLRGLMKK